MKFGSREICDVVFKAKSAQTIGSKLFQAGQPVLYIDTAKTSTLEGAAATVYAQGGKGNARLIGWDGEKTLTFTVEDALLSPMGFSILSGAGLLDKADAGSDNHVYVHSTARATVDADGKINLTDALGEKEKISTKAPLFAMLTEADGSLTGDLVSDLTVDADGKSITGATGSANKNVFVDFYIEKTEAVTELQIDAGNFAGSYYVEASTLFRRESDGKDMPAEITIPNAKIQSNFNFAMASTGDPSTFSFVMDAFPGYTMFDATKKVLCVIQIVDETSDKSGFTSVMDQVSEDTKENVIANDSAAGN